MNSSFEYTATLEYRLKAACAQIQAFKSGEKYVRMEREHQKEIRFLERRIRKLEQELSRAHSEIVTVRNQWFEIFEELQKECDQTVKVLKKEKRVRSSVHCHRRFWMTLISKRHQRQS